MIYLTNDKGERVDMEKESLYIQNDMVYKPSYDTIIDEDGYEAKVTYKDDVTSQYQIHVEDGLRSRPEVEEKLKIYKEHANKYDLDLGYASALMWVLNDKQ